VGIKFIAATCNACEDCEAGDEAICASAKSSIYDVPGTFQQFAVACTSQLTPIPAGLDMAVAAPILCAGLTVWKGLKTTQAKKGQWVAIPGAGGGLGSLAVQYAVYMGLKVIAIDTGAEKRHMLEGMGVDSFIDFRETPDVVKA
jgi:propanol-preferring alcohol dehydrogenase